MKTLIIYTSQTGFTKRYAEWIAEKMSGELLDLRNAQKKSADYFKDFDAICYGGWAMAGNLVKGKWFLEKASDLQDKRLAMFCVGGGPNDNPDVDAFLQNVLTEEQKKYIKVFYCQGGLNYEKMKAPSRLAMKMFVSTLRNKKDATEKEKAMAEKMASSYDISDVKYIEPIVAYLLEKDNEKAV
ncbi:flavodoxin [Butyrivibrio sp. X503]|uniref:flavodoxin domain-containing protein n=1 Tax=Butyrivibrio sp. X503 TaxID=2364878 RepID=UPI000EA8A4B3|nr:flavodoxin domain-containing protein [Butyrivibrio sp. X503]RKM55203.1 flavodoxin [Butyrivibrio sp. X503]